MIARAREVMRRADLVTIAAGLALGLAALTLIQAVVSGLIAPLIAVFIGESRFESNVFTIGSSEFAYGFVIEDAIVLAIVAAIAYFLVVLWRRDEEGRPLTRACPECTSEIPAAARRCPRCTAPISPQTV